MYSCFYLKVAIAVDTNGGGGGGTIIQWKPYTWLVGVSVAMNARLVWKP